MNIVEATKTVLCVEDLDIDDSKTLEELGADSLDLLDIASELGIEVSQLNKPTIFMNIPLNELEAKLRLNEN